MTTPDAANEPSLRSDVLRAYAGIALGLLAWLVAAFVFRRADVLTAAVLLGAVPPIAIGLLMAFPRRPRSSYRFRLESALAGCVAAYAGLAVVNLFLYLLAALDPALRVALILGWEGTLVALVMAAREHLRARPAPPLEDTPWAGLGPQRRPGP